MLDQSAMLPPQSRDSRPRLLILGCSVRAAAWSAVRAGFRPVCADQFGDEDLRQVAEVLPVRNYPASLPDDVRHTTAAAWVYTGALEHQPRILEQLASVPTIGACMATVSIAGNPLELQSAALAAGLQPPRIWSDAAANPPPDGTWLCKPRTSGGGIGIRVWDGATSRRMQLTELEEGDPAGPQVYFQELASGEDCSAIFLMNEGQAHFLGASAQLIGEDWTGTEEPFGYAGNIGPISLTRVEQLQLTKMLSAYDRHSQQRGLLGIDFVRGVRGIQPVEINPRYTASCEVLELATGVSFLALASGALMPKSLSPARVPLGMPHVRTVPRMVGKLIVYARRPVIAPDLSRFLVPRSPWTIPFLADIPACSTEFETGQPLCTVFASGSSWDAVADKLRRRAQRVQRWFREI